MYSQMLIGTIGSLRRFNRMPGFGNGGTGAVGSWMALIVRGFICLAFLALIVALVVWLVRRARVHHAGGPAGSQTVHTGYWHPDSTATRPQATDSQASAFQAANAQALAILSERYARGEIGEEEYIRMKKNLTE